MGCRGCRLISAIAALAFLSLPRHAAAQAAPSPFSNLIHGWDTVGDMLAGNFGSFSPRFNTTPAGEANWRWMAHNYGAIALNGWLERWNGTAPSPRAQVARKLKSINPNIRLFLYFACSWVSQDPPVQAAINAHPEWWLRDDHGNIQTTGTMKHVDTSRPDVQGWWSELALAEFPDRAEALQVLSGVFADGTSFRNPNPQNISDARYRALHAGKVAMLNMTHQLFRVANGGELWGNPLLEYGDISGNLLATSALFGTSGSTHGLPSALPQPVGDDPNPGLSLDFPWGGAFDEMFGSFGTQLRNGSWDITKMNYSINAILNVTQQGHSVLVHSFPGPATVPFTAVGAAGAYPSWAGPEVRPSTVDGLKKASVDRLVESLAPFLIVANERTWLSYAWFYDADTGYVPCDDDPQSCSVPQGWYSDFARPLGQPLGPAHSDGNTRWSRAFQHAQVSIDLQDRAKSSITWS